MKLPVLAASSFGTAAVSMALFGAGVATAAPDVTGETYSDASAAIEDAGGKAVVATRVGDKLEQGDCIVTGASDSSFLRPMTTDVYFEGDADEVALNLNCEGGVATAKNPGASVASPLGKLAIAKADEEAAADEEQALEDTSKPGA